AARHQFFFSSAGGVAGCGDSAGFGGSAAFGASAGLGGSAFFSSVLAGSGFFSSGFAGSAFFSSGLGAGVSLFFSTAGRGFGLSLSVRRNANTSARCCGLGRRNAILLPGIIAPGLTRY